MAANLAFVIHDSFASSSSLYRILVSSSSSSSSPTKCVSHYFSCNTNYYINTTLQLQLELLGKQNVGKFLSQKDAKKNTRLVANLTFFHNLPHFLHSFFMKLQLFETPFLRPSVSHCPYMVYICKSMRKKQRKTM